MGQAHLRWAGLKWKSVLWSDESIFQNVLGNDGSPVFLVKAKKADPDYFRSKVKKTASVMVWGRILVPLASWVSGTSVQPPLRVEQHLLPSRRDLFSGVSLLISEGR